jgi:hypothetical protein
MIGSHINKPAMAEDGEQGVDVGLRGEVQPGPDVPARGGNPRRVSTVQAIDCVLHVLLRLLRVLNIPQ